MRDLVVLAADKHIEQTMLALVGRHHSVPSRSITCDVLVHPGRDPGCYSSGHALLRDFARTHRHALVVFDRAWDGAPSADPRTLEAKVEGELAEAWGHRAACVVIDPEVEVWVFADSPNVDEALGWRGRTPNLRTWLGKQGFVSAGELKPRDPKAAFEAALRVVRIPPSSAIFAALGRTVGFERCTDPSFVRLRSLLAGWFPPSTGAP